MSYFGSGVYAVRLSNAACIGMGQWTGNVKQSKQSAFDFN